MKDPSPLCPHLWPPRLIQPGSHTPPRTAATPNGLIDLRTVPLDPIPDPARHYAVASVGVTIGTEFEAREIPSPNSCPPGAVLITYGAATAPGQVAVVVGLAESGQIATIGLWPSINAAWPEIARTSAVFGASHRTRNPR
jgi:hypothetical protein